MKNTLIKNDKFRVISKNVKPDVKRRIVLSKSCIDEGVTYHVYCNEIGQIILDPQVSIPASELWIFRNQAASEAVARGLKEAAEGKISKIKIDEL